MRQLTPSSWSGQGNEIYHGGFCRLGQIGDDSLNLFQHAETRRVAGFWCGGLSCGERMDIEPSTNTRLMKTCSMRVILYPLASLYIMESGDAYLRLYDSAQDLRRGAHAQLTYADLAFRA